MPLFVELVIEFVLRVLAGPFDRRRIRRHFESQGATVWRIEWTPFATGWLSNWHDRFYLVQFDAHNAVGNLVTCRTNWRGAVVIVDDEHDDIEPDAAADNGEPSHAPPPGERG